MFAENHRFAVGSIPTLLTLAYFVKLIGALYQRAPASTDAPLEIPLTLSVSLGVLSAAMIGLGLLSDPIIGFFLDFAQRGGL